MLYSVTLDSFENEFPAFGTPLSLVGISKIIVSECNLNGTCIIMNLIGRDIHNAMAYPVPTEGLELIVPNSNPWVGLMFIGDSIPAGREATFECELIAEG